MAKHQQVLEAERPEGGVQGGMRIPTKLQSLLAKLSDSLNFYRVHVIYFTIVRAPFPCPKSSKAHSSRLPPDPPDLRRDHVGDVDSRLRHSLHRLPVLLHVRHDRHWPSDYQPVHLDAFPAGVAVHSDADWESAGHLAHHHHRQKTFLPLCFPSCYSRTTEARAAAALVQSRQDFHTCRHKRTAVGHSQAFQHQSARRKGAQRSMSSVVPALPSIS